MLIAMHCENQNLVITESKNEGDAKSRTIYRGPSGQGPKFGVAVDLYVSKQRYRTISEVGILSFTYNRWVLDP